MSLSTISRRILEKRIRTRKISNVEVPQTGNEQLDRVLLGMQEQLRLYEGTPLAPKERFVTLEDLEQSGLVQLSIGRGFASIAGILGEPARRVKSVNTSSAPAETTTTSTDSAVTDADIENLIDLEDVSATTRVSGSFIYYEGPQWKDTAGLFSFDFTNTRVEVKGGYTFRVHDTSGNDYIDFSHDGTDALLQFANTTALSVMDGVELRVYDSTGADYLSLSHDGAANIIGTNAGRMYFQDAGQYRFYDSSNTAKFSIDVGTSQIFFENSVAHTVAFWEDGDGTLYYTFNFQGTNGPGFTINRGNELELRGTTGANKVDFRHDNTDFNITAANTASIKFVGATNYRFDNSVFITESADDNADIAGDGQFWVEDKVPNSPRFTGDAGNKYTLNNLFEGAYEYDTVTTASDPGAGVFRFDNASVGSAAALYINDSDGIGQDYSWVLDHLTTGDQITFMSELDRTDYLVVTVSGTPTDNTGWWTVPITPQQTGFGFAGDTDQMRVVVTKLSELTGTLSLGDLSDVDIAMLADNALLVYNSSSGNWEDASNELSWTGTQLNIVGNLSATAAGTNVLGGETRFRDAGTTDWVAFDHDGTDFNIVGTNTADINITGITAIAAGTVDADFDAITATSYGGIAEADLMDRTADETYSGTMSFTDPGLKPIVLLNNAYIYGTDTGAVDRTLFAIDSSNVVQIGTSGIGSILLRATTDCLGDMTATSFGGIAEANLVSKIAAETIVAQWTFDVNPEVDNTSPAYRWIDNDGAADETRFTLRYQSGQVRFQNRTDLDAGPVNWLTMDRTGMNTDDVTITADDINLTGAVNAISGDIITLGAGGAFVIAASGNVAIEDGKNFYIKDATNTDYGFMYHDGTSFYHEYVNTQYVRYKMDGASGGFAWTDGGLFKIWIDQASERFDLRDGYTLRIEDAGDTDYADFSHDGTDFNTDFVNTTDWNIGGLPAAGHMNLQARLRIAGSGWESTPTAMLLGQYSAGVGYIQVPNSGAIEMWAASSSAIARFNNDLTSDFMGAIDVTGDITATSYEGIVAADILSKSAAATIAASYTFTAANAITISSGSPEIHIRETGATADEGNWTVRASGDIFKIQTATDATPDSAEDTVFQINRSGATATLVDFLNLSLGVRIKDGAYFRIFDATDTDYAEFSHDGTDFLTAFTNTTAWNLTGITKLDATESIIEGLYMRSDIVTQTNLRDSTHAVNTNAGKQNGAWVYDNTNNMPVYAQGNGDTSVWKDAAGNTVHTPIP